MSGYVMDAPPVVLRAHEQVRDEIKRADTKATTLLSLPGLVLAGVVALAKAGLPVPALVFLWLGALPVFWSVLVLLATIRPRLGQYPTPGTWLHATAYGPQALLDAGTYAGRAAAEDVCVLGAIAVDKYRRVQSAINLLIIGAAVLAVALALAVLV
jgi:hypothetical protein